MRLMRVLPVLCVSLATLGAAAAPSGDADWIACTQVPTRTCVFDEAFKIARVPAATSGSPVRSVLFAYSAVDPQGALRFVPAAEALAKTLYDGDERWWLESSIASVYAKAGNFREAERVLARLKDTSAYDSSAQALAGDVARAQSVTEAIARVRAFAIAPEMVGLFVMEVAPLAVARGEDAALMAFAEEAERAWVPPRDAQYGFAPVLDVALAQLEAGKVQPALAAAGRVSRYTARVAALGSLGATLALAGRADEALAAVLTIDSAVERGAVLGMMVLPRGSGTRFLREPPAALVRPARVAASMELAASLSPEQRNDAYVLVVRSCVASRALAEAWGAARQITTPLASFQALMTIGEAEAMAGNARASLETFAQARAIAGADVTGRLIYELTSLQARLGQVEAAEAMFREESRRPYDKRDRATMRMTLTGAMARAGRVDDAFRVAQSGDDSSLVAPQEFIVYALADAGLTREALALASRPSDDKYYDREQVLGGVVNVRVREGAIDDAATALALMTSRTERLQALVTLAEAHARAGNGAKALATVREALPLLQAGEPDGGLQYLLRAGAALPR